MKIQIFTGACLALTLAFTACDDTKAPAEKVKSNGLPTAQTKQSHDIAYVEIDSLATQYEFCKDGLKALEAKQNSLRAQITKKGQALQNGMSQFEKNMQNGTFTSEAQARGVQENLMKQDQQLRNFQQKAEMQMAEATEAYQTALRDSIASFIKDFNHDGRYKLILSKSGDNMLYADGSLNITAEVVAGLNKRYKK